MRVHASLAVVLVLASASFGASSQADPRFKLTLDDTGSLIIDLELPSLEQCEIELAGVRYQDISIRGGAHRGAPGQAALPVITRLVAIPAGAQVAVAVKSADLITRHGWRLPPRQPVARRLSLPGKSQPPSKPDIAYDEVYYATPDRRRDPTVEAGRPAWLFGQQVVPITFLPVKYDPTTSSVTIARHMQVLVTITGAGKTVPVEPGPHLVPESFQHMLRQAVLGYDGRGAEVGPGSCLYICPDNSEVTGRLGPLIQWRRRQGYEANLVTLAQTGYTNVAIKTYLQQLHDSSDPPLEYVCLVGDANGPYAVPTWQENVSGFHGEGDHYYTTLAGGDLLPDIHIGRLSFQDLATLDVILAKILSYEITPPTTDDPDWFQRACLVGDPLDSGESTIYVNQWLKTQLLGLNYTEIDTIWSGNFPLRMMTEFNEGDTVVGYRGFYGTSNFTTAHVRTLTNGPELPFVVMITCDTGSFLHDNACMSETWLRAPNGGGVAAVSTATGGTHTRYNNVMYAGIFEGLLNTGDFRAGSALSRGKLEMWLQYGQVEPQNAHAWMVWNNLMGDPATRIWTGFPRHLNVQHPAGLPVGAGSLQVAVTDDGGAAVPAARVALHKAGEILLSGHTDGTGQVLLSLPGHTAGDLQITVTGINSLPYLGSLVLGTESEHLDIAGVQIDDDAGGSSQGNGDGLAAPGETVELAIQVSNLGPAVAPEVTAVLSTADPRVSLLVGSAVYGAIAAGTAAWNVEPFVCQLAAGTPGGLVIPFTLDIHSGAETWTALVELTAHAGACRVQDLVWSGAGQIPGPGQTATLNVVLLNEGNLDISWATATLNTPSMWITPLDTAGTYGPIAVGQSTTNQADPFSLYIADDCYGGHLATLEMALAFASGARDTVVCLVPVGEAAAGDPLGPDSHGYGAFDNTDVLYQWAPTFDWVEIDPDHGGNGISLGLDDSGLYDDDTHRVDLPFTFKYYGQDFDRISVCSNGWLAMGATYLKNFRNLGIPCTGVPDNLLAVFWDDLFMWGSSDVLTWYDPANGRFVVEWSRMRNVFDSLEETFQAILYDPAVHPTFSGDGIIKFQYLAVNSSDHVNGYHTVGIQAESGAGGLLYTYWNQGSPAAAPIQAGRAITFLPMQPPAVGHVAGHVDNASAGAPLAGASVALVGSGRTFTTRPDGGFLGSVPAATYLVVASHPSCAADSLPAVSIAAGETVTLSFTLADNLGPEITGTTRLPDTEDIAGPYPVETTLSDLSGLAETHFFYETSAGPAVHELPLVPVDLPAGTYRAEIPGQTLETMVWYWLVATDIAGNQTSDPAGAPAQRYRFAVVQKDTLLHDDMEAGLGWEVIPDDGGLISGRWERCDPNGTYLGEIMVQPEDDASPPPGVMCWITGNDMPGTDPGGHDVDGIPATLLSPWYDLSGYDGVTLSYRRWFTNDLGNNPGEDPWRVLVTDDGETWTAMHSSTESQLSWLLQSHRVEDFLELGPTVRFKFLVTDEGGDSLVEAGLDELVLTGYTLDPTTSVGDSPSPQLALAQNRPNPFNPSTEIRFALPRGGEVRLQVFDLEGRLVRSLLSEVMPAGSHRVVWQGDDHRGVPVASGVYFYRLQTGTGDLVRKMTVLK